MSIGPCTGKRWVCHLTYDQSSHQSQVLKEKNTIVDKIHQNQHIFNQLWDVIPYAVGFSHHADDKNSVKSMTFDARNGPALAVPVSYFAFPDSMQAAVAQPGLTRLTLENVTMDIDEYRRQLESSPWASSTSGPPSIPLIRALHSHVGYEGLFTGVPARISACAEQTVAQSPQSHTGTAALHGPVDGDGERGGAVCERDQRPGGNAFCRRVRTLRARRS